MLSNMNGWLVFIVVTLAAFPSGSGARDIRDAAATPEKRDILFSWLDSLGQLDVGKAAWVEVQTGEMRQEKDQSWKPVRIRGFIERDEAQIFKVLSLELLPSSFTKVAKDVAGHEPVFWEPRSLEADSREVLDSLHRWRTDFRDPSAPENPRWPEYLTNLPLRSSVIVLAWACHRQGHSQLAADLFAEAAWYRWPGERTDKSPDLRAELERDLGQAAMQRAMLSVGSAERNGKFNGLDSPLVPRRELLARFRDIVRLYPGSEHVPLARDIAATLERMVPEDDAHPAVSDEALAKLPVEEQVRELVFRLRDQRGYQMLSKGSCDIFFDLTFGMREGSSPAHSLAKIGLPAVPQLIASIGDERLSRASDLVWHSFSPHQIRTVGDCAEAVLQRIAGRTFWTSRPGYSGIPKEEDIAARRALAEAWWNEVQAKGEKQVLVSTIASGKVHIGDLVQKLRARWPEALLDALLLGAPRATELYVRYEFIRELGAIEDDRATKFLLSELHEGPKVWFRAAAAEALRPKNHPDALPAMLREWRNLPVPKPGEFAGLTSVLQFLVASQSEDAMNALPWNWEQRSIEERADIVFALACAEWLDGAVDVKQSPALPPPPGAVAAAEEMLALALEDTSVRQGMSFGWGEYSFSDPRVCDIALYALHRAFPARYACSPKASRRKTERERLIAANQWRVSQRLPLLPVPEFRLTPLKPEEALQVVEVTIAQDLAVPDDARREIEQLRGTAFSPARLLAVITQYANSPWQGVTGIQVEATREDDLTGVVIAVTAREGNNYPRWGAGYFGSVGGVIFARREYNYKKAAGHSEGSWDEFIRRLDHELGKAKPDTPFEVFLSLRSPKRS
jgi:hypothetical protein